MKPDGWVGAHGRLESNRIDDRRATIDDRRASDGGFSSPRARYIEPFVLKR
jgi:hypothetical protein